MRSFIAIAPPDHVRDALADLQAEAPVGRAVAWEKLHLTLAFLGDQPTDTLRELDATLARVDTPGFEAVITGLDVFGGRTPRILAALLRPDAALTALHDQVRRAARGAGCDLPRDRFRPHVTLLRFKHRLQTAESADLARFLSASGALRLGFPVQSFGLYQSTLTPDGPVYAELAAYALRGATP